MCAMWPSTGVRFEVVPNRQCLKIKMVSSTHKEKKIPIFSMRTASRRDVELKTTPRIQFSEHLTLLSLPRNKKLTS